MFGGRFSHIRFSLRDDSLVSEREAFETYSANLKAVITFAANLNSTETYSASMQTKAGIAPGLLAREEYTAYLTVKALGANNYRANEEYIAAMQNKVILAVNHHITEEYGAELQNNTRLAADYGASEKYAAELISKVTANTNYNANEIYTGTMFAVIDVDILDYETAVITVSIPANSELRIDTGNHTVTLNGVNVIHQHSGAWFTLSRDVVDMLISSGGGVLDGRLIYQERYL